MKQKIITILGIFAFCLVFVTGCTSEDNNTGVTDVNGSSKSSFNINETAVFEDVYYTVTNVEYSNGIEFDEPDSGKEFVIVTVKIENKSDSTISYNTLDWEMLNSQGQMDNETFTTIDSDTNLGSGDLAAGGTKTGTIVFEEPKNDSSLKLQYYSNSLFDENATFDIVIK